MGIEPGATEARARHLVRRTVHHIAFGFVYLFFLVLMLLEWMQGDMTGLVTWGFLLLVVVGFQMLLRRHRENST